MSKTSSKRILITGGAGFIGSHLCEQLAQQGHTLFCLDNLFTGSQANIEHLQGKNNFQFIHHDLIYPLETLREIEESPLDEIYNLACPASPVHYQHDPIQTLKTSVLGAIHLLELARTKKAKILQASTSEVYGDPLEHPQKESYWGNVNPVGQRSCYDEGKRCAETLFVDYSRKYDMDIKIIRIFNTYGPRMHPQDGRVVSNFIVQALQGKEITIYGDGTQTRSFCYVDDLVEGIKRTMEQEKSFSGPLNLGNPHEFSVGQLAQIVIELTGTSSQIKYLDLPSDDPRQRRPHINLAQNQLQWEPKIQLRQGLQQTIEHFKKTFRGLKGLRGLSLK